MKKIVFSLAMIVAVGAAVVGATGAFFTDTETSTGNTFTAGSLDLKIDSECHYNGFVCRYQIDDIDGPGYYWVDETGQQGDGEVPTPYVYPGVDCDCTWSADDLDGDPLFVYEDLKPGDWGENTISIHVIDNDAYGRVKFVGSANADNGINEPEGKSAEEDGLDTNWCGELAQNMVVDIWLDEGSTPGWQNSDEIKDNDDPEEGDNILNGVETIIDTTVVMTEAEAALACADDGQNTVETNWLNIGLIEGDVTHYYGLGWNIPTSVGNEIQSDSIAFDVVFEVEQARHNDNPFTPAVPMP